MKKIQTKLLMLLLTVIMTYSTNAQNITQPRVSQQATISQRLGISDITIVYHSPSVQGRQVFGGIVPYGSIWRAGANENTTIHFTHDAKIEGQNIDAGTYGLYMLPESNGEVKVLFSKFSKSWGTNPPTEQDLAAMVTVKSSPIPFQEWLSYDFIDRGSKSLTAVLQWEKTRIPFKIEFDVNKIVIDNARAELKGPAGFGWRGYNDAANYCLQNDTNLDEALVWIEKSLAIARGFTNGMVKAGILMKKGKLAEAEKIANEAFPTGNANQINQYGYTLLGMKKIKEAIKVFTYNVETNASDPFIWGYMDSLGEAYLADGDKANALKYYKLAKTKAPANQHAYLDDVITGIK